MADQCPLFARNSGQRTHAPPFSTIPASTGGRGGFQADGRIVPATKQHDGQNFAFAVGQIAFTTLAILSLRKGRWPSSPNVGMGCGGRGGVGREVCSQGGINSVSGRRHARRTMPERTTKSCGPDASVVGVKSQRRYGKPDRAEVPVSVRRRRQESPIHRGERDISRKAIAQGMSECLR
jgi:hypothetical protein